MTERIRYADREICANCTYWSTLFRYPYDAGTAAMCEKLSQQRAHMSCESTMIMDENNGDKPAVIWTRHTFGCNMFVKDTK